MASNSPLQKTLVEFYKVARQLWGRCPCCGDLFRLSDAAISCGTEPPRDWLRKQQREQEELKAKQADINQWHAELDRQETELRERERDLMLRERGIEALARQRAKEMLKDGSSVKKLIREAQQQSIKRSRSTLLGHFFERLAPFLQRFEHDPRDVRPLYNPIDYVCFDGLTVNRKVDKITFVEVKCGTSKLSPTQRSVSEAIRNGRVFLEEWQFGQRGIPIEQQLLKAGGVPRYLPPGEV